MGPTDRWIYEDRLKQTDGCTLGQFTNNDVHSRPCGIRNSKITSLEKEKMLVPSIFSVSHNAFFLSRTNPIICATYIFSSANNLNLTLSEILSSGEALKRYDCLNLSTPYSCGKNKVYLIWS